jgi:hypothetical protein
MVDHLSEQNRGFLMIFFNIFSSEPHLEIFATGEKKIAGEISKKIITTFWGHDIFHF